MKFTQLSLASNLLAELGLHDVPYEVPTVYLEHVGLDPASPPLIAMLFALQQRMADGVAPRKLARLISRPGASGWGSAGTNAQTRNG